MPVRHDCVMTPINVQVLMRTNIAICIVAPRDLSPHLGCTSEMIAPPRDQQEGGPDILDMEHSLGSIIFGAGCDQSVEWQSLGAAAEMVLRSDLS
jgi:hypothetical protein